MSAGLVSVNGTRLFVDDRGPHHGPTLLYLHGGPGLGCHDFMAVQGDALARSMRLIGVDQRGVLRSDDLPADPQVSVELLIDDAEALRRRLGVESWFVLGHSAGGHYALAYATSHPQSVSGVIFDCPCWDCDLTDRYRLSQAAELLMDQGNRDAADRCLTLAGKPGRIEYMDRSWEAMQELGETYSSLFYATPASASRAEQIMARGSFTDRDLSRGRSHEPLLAAMYRSRLELVDQLVQPSLLCHGRHDLVTPPQVIAYYDSHAPCGRVHSFDHSAHFSYLEQPAEYASVVSSFVASARSKVHTG